ncbi:hypothetical protein PC39_02205 [Salinisphaera sp. PC39]|uniref:ArnT family glycosyltransferase n=1 Tax=Salinisphaera sp. PC39 TaxID=1304156 RepID=UPI00334226C5
MTGTYRSTALICLVLILAAAAWLRFEATAETLVQAPIRADAGQYVAYAYNLKHHGVYSRQKPSGESPPTPDAVRSPGYPLFLTAFFDAFSKQELDRLLLGQAALGTATVLLSYLLFRLFLPVGLALAGSALTALSPHLISLETYVLTETLFCFLLVGGLYVLTLAQRRANAVPWLLLAGTVLATCALVRPIMQYFVVALPILLFLHDRKAPILRPSLLFAAGFVAVFAWWPLRNLVVLGMTSDPHLVINFLHHGHYPDFMYEGRGATFGSPYHFDPASPEFSKSVKAALVGIWERIVNEPARYLAWFLLGKPLAFWSWSIVAGAGGIFVYPVLQSPFLDNVVFQSVVTLMQHAHGPILVLALIAAIMVWAPSLKRDIDPATLFAARLCVFVLVYFTGLHMIGAPFPRYAVPLRPLLYGVACLAPLLGFVAARSLFKEFYSRGAR